MIDRKTVVVHACCVAGICFGYGGARLLFKSEPLVAFIAVTIGFFVWGKFGFKPAAVVFEKLVARIDPNEVMRILSQRSAGSVQPTPTVVVAVIEPMPAGVLPVAVLSETEEETPRVELAPIVVTPKSEPPK